VERRARLEAARQELVEVLRSLREILEETRSTRNSVETRGYAKSLGASRHSS